jgi:hypothetical protein
MYMAEVDVLINDIIQLDSMPSDNELTDVSISKFESILERLPGLNDPIVIGPLISLFGYGEGNGMYWSLLHYLEEFDAGVVDPILLSSLCSANPGVRMWSAYMLGRSRNQKASDSLIALTRDDFELVRRNSLIALEMISPDIAYKIATELLHDSSREVTTEAKRIFSHK